MFPLSLEAKLIAWALAIAGMLGGLAWFIHHERDLGASAVNAAVSEQHVKDVAEASAHNEKIHTAQEAADHEADRFNLAAALDARDAVGADRRLQQRFAAINARCVPGDPTASAASPAASDAADLRADVLRRIVQAARSVASAADAGHGAGLDAEQHYDALSSP